MILRFATAGSVDDGKSTLIGRLLNDLGELRDDQMEALRRASPQGKVDLSLVTDGLRAEREQKITIDVAYRYFETAQRKFILADTPGHEQYTRNMITGASGAELVILLVDARKGLTAQTRRHALLCSLLRVPQIVLAVNKMDAVDYSRARYSAIQDEFLDFCSRLEFPGLTSIPISALEGDNVLMRSRRMEWYQGPTLMQHLNEVHVTRGVNTVDFRFAVQHVIRPHQDFRGLAGTVCSGRVRAGHTVVLLPSGKETTVKRVLGPDGDVAEGLPGKSLVLELEDEVEAGRGTMMARTQNRPELGTNLDCTVCWMGDAPMRRSAQYWLLHTTRKVRCVVETVHYRIDVETLHQQEAETLGINDIGRLHLRTTEPLAYDRYVQNRATGSFVLVDADTNQTVAAGMIRGPAEPRRPRAHVFPESGSVRLEEREKRQGHRACILWFTGLSGAGKSTLARLLERRLFDLGCNTFYLDGDNLRHGLNSDLDFSAGGRAENIRRAAAAAQLGYQHGSIVLCSFISPYAADRALARRVVPEGRFFELFVDCSLAECARRDVKGLYQRALAGELSEFTGVSAPYEAPEHPDAVLATDRLSPEEAVERVVQLLRARDVLERG